MGRNDGSYPLYWIATLILFGVHNTVVTKTDHRGEGQDPPPTTKTDTKSGPAPFQISTYSPLALLEVMVKARKYSEFHRELLKMNAAQLKKVQKELLGRTRIQQSSQAAQYIRTGLQFHLSGKAKSLFAQAKEILAKKALKGSDKASSPYHQSFEDIAKKSLREQTLLLHVSGYLLDPARQKKWFEIRREFIHWHKTFHQGKLLELLSQKDLEPFHQLLFKLHTDHSVIFNRVLDELKAKKTLSKQQQKLLDHMSYYLSDFERNHYPLRQYLENPYRARKFANYLHPLEVLAQLSATQRAAHRAQLSPKAQKRFDRLYQDLLTLRQAKAKKTPRLKYEKFFEQLAKEKNLLTAFQKLKSQLKKSSALEREQLRKEFILYFHSNREAAKKSPFLTGRGPSLLSVRDWFDFALRNADTDLQSKLNLLAKKSRHRQGLEDALFELATAFPALAHDLRLFIAIADPKSPKDFPVQANWWKTLDTISERLDHYVHHRPKQAEKIAYSDAQKWLDNQTWEPKTFAGKGADKQLLQHLVTLIDEICGYDCQLAKRRLPWGYGTPFSRLRKYHFGDPALQKAAGEMTRALRSHDRWQYEKARRRYIQAKLEYLKKMHGFVDDPNAWKKAKPSNISSQAWRGWRTRVLSFLRDFGHADPKPYSQVSYEAYLTEKFNGLKIAQLRSEELTAKLKVHYLELIQNCVSNYRYYLRSNPFRFPKVYCAFLSKYNLDLETLAADPKQWRQLKPVFRSVTDPEWELFRQQTELYLRSNSLKHLPIVHNEPDKLLEHCESKGCLTLLKLLIPKATMSTRTLASPLLFRNQLAEQFDIAMKKYKTAKLQRELEEQSKKRIERELTQIKARIIKRNIDQIPGGKEKLVPKKREQRILFSRYKTRRNLLYHDVLTGNSPVAPRRIADPKELQYLIETSKEITKVLKASQTQFIARTIGLPKFKGHPILGDDPKRVLSQDILRFETTHKQLEQLRQWILSQVTIKKEGKTFNLALTKENQGKVKDPVDRERLLLSLGGLLSLLNHAAIDGVTKPQGATGAFGKDTQLIRKGLIDAQNSANSVDHALTMFLEEAIAFRENPEDAQRVKKFLLPFIVDPKGRAMGQTLPGASWIQLLKLRQIAKDEEKKKPQQIPNIYFNWLIRLSHLMPKWNGGLTELRKLILLPSPSAIMEYAKKYDAQLFNYLNEQGQLPDQYTEFKIRKKQYRDRFFETLVQGILNGEALEKIPHPELKKHSAWQSLRLLLEGDAYQKIFSRFEAQLSTFPKTERARIRRFLEEHSKKTRALVVESASKPITFRVLDKLSRFTQELSIRFELERKHSGRWKKFKGPKRAEQIERFLAKEISTELDKLKNVSERRDATGKLVEAARNRIQLEVAKRKLLAAMKTNKQLSDLSKKITDIQPKTLYEELQKLMLPIVPKSYFDKKSGRMVSLSEKERIQHVTRLIEEKRLEIFLYGPMMDSMIQDWEKANKKSLWGLITGVPKDTKALKEIEQKKEELQLIIRQYSAALARKLKDLQFNHDNQDQDEKKVSHWQQRLARSLKEYIDYIQRKSARFVEIDKLQKQLHEIGNESILHDLEWLKTKTGQDDGKLALRRTYTIILTKVQADHLSLLHDLSRDIEESTRQVQEHLKAKVLKALASKLPVHYKKMNDSIKKLLGKSYFPEFFFKLATTDIEAEDIDTLIDWLKEAKLTKTPKKFMQFLKDKDKKEDEGIISDFRTAIQQIYAIPKQAGPEIIDHIATKILQARLAKGEDSVFHHPSWKAHQFLLRLLPSQLEKNLRSSEKLKRLTQLVRHPDQPVGKKELPWTGKSSDPLMDILYHQFIHTEVAKHSDKEIKKKVEEIETKKLQAFDRKALQAQQKEKPKRNQLRKVLTELGIIGYDLTDEKAFTQAKLHLLYERTGPVHCFDHTLKIDGKYIERKSGVLTARAKRLRKALGKDNLSKIREYLLEQFDRRAQPVYFFELNSQTAMKVLQCGQGGGELTGELIMLTPLRQERLVAQRAYEKVKELVIPLRKAADDVGAFKNWIQHAYPAFSGVDKGAKTSYEKKYGKLDERLRKAISQLEERRGLRLVDSSGTPQKRGGAPLSVGHIVPEVRGVQRNIYKYFAVMPEKWVAEAEAGYNLIMAVATWFLPGSKVKAGKSVLTLYNLHKRARAMKLLLGAINLGKIGAFQIGRLYSGLYRMLGSGIEMGTKLTLANHLVAAAIHNAIRFIEQHYKWEPGGSRVDSDCKIKKEHHKDVPRYLDWNHDGILDYCQGGSVWEWAVTPKIDQVWSQMVSSSITFGLAGRLTPWIPKIPLLRRLPQSWHMMASTTITGFGTSVGGDLIAAYKDPKKQGGKQLSPWESLVAKATDFRTYLGGLGEGIKMGVMASPVDDLFAGWVKSEAIAKLGAFGVNSLMSGLYAGFEHTVFNPVTTDEDGYTSGGYQTTYGNRTAGGFWSAFGWGIVDSAGGDLRAATMAMKSRMTAHISRDFAKGISIEDIRKKYSKKAEERGWKGIVEETLAQQSLKSLTRKEDGVIKRKDNFDSVVEEIAKLRGIKDDKDIELLKDYLQNKLRAQKQTWRPITHFVDAFLYREAQTLLKKMKTKEGRRDPKIIERLLALPQLALKLDVKRLFDEKQQKANKDNDHTKLLLELARLHGLDPDIRSMPKYLKDEFYAYQKQMRAKKLKATLSRFFAHLRKKSAIKLATAYGTKLWQLKGRMSSQDQKLWIWQLAHALGIDVRIPAIRDHLIAHLREEVRETSPGDKSNTMKKANYSLAKWLAFYKSDIEKVTGLAKKKERRQGLPLRVKDLTLDTNNGVVLLHYLATRRLIPVHNLQVWNALLKFVRAPARKNKPISNILHEFHRSLLQGDF